MLRHSIRRIAVDQTTAFSPGEMMCDGVNGYCRLDCSRTVEKTQTTKMAPHESAVIAPGVGATMTEACHVPLDRPGTARTCYLVADKFGFANCQTVAPPALGDMQEGRAAVPGGTASTILPRISTSIRQSGGRGPKQRSDDATQGAPGRNTDRR